MGNTRRNCEPQWSLICLWPSLATSMNFNISPHYPQANGKAERGPRRQEDIEAVTSLSCTFVVPSKTSNIHRHEPLPFDSGKINPHPPTYIGIQLEAGSTEPRSCYQKGRAIQNCIPSALWQETWTATPSRPKARWLSSCKVRSAERVPGKVIARSPTPPSYVIQKPLCGVVTTGVQSCKILITKNLSKFAWKPLEDTFHDQYHHANKFFGESFLFNLHYLCYLYIYSLKCV